VGVGPLEGLRRGWEGGIGMILGGCRLDDVSGSGQWRALVNMAMNFRVL
jgi:hypothetical protein